MEFIIIIIGLILDRLTKIWAMGYKNQKGISVIKDFFQFEYLENRGAAFGIFQNKVIFLSIITFVIIGAIIVYLIRFAPKSKWLRVSLALIISGALGNLFDRIFYNYVVDFISIHFKQVYYFPTFNVADMLVVVGTFMLAIYIIRDVK
jgi:signal peptidase II